MRLAVIVAAIVAASVLGPPAAEAQYYALTNVAKGRPVSAATGNFIGSPANVTDGKADSYWFSFFLQDYTVDLGAEVTIGRIVVFAYQGAAIQILSSSDGTTFTQRHAFNATDAQHSGWIGGLVSGPLAFDANGAYSARYLRYRSESLGCGCYQGSAEFEVYPWVSTIPPALGGTNVATLGGVTVTDVLASAPGFSSANVTDGDVATSWKGAHAGWYTGMAGQQWGYVFGRARIDLGSEVTVHGLRVRRPSAGGAQTVSISLYDGSDREIASVGHGDPAVVGTRALAFGDVDFVLDIAVQARYIRVYQMNPLVPALSIQPALAEVEVYGTVTYPDATPPELTGMPSDISVEATSAAGAVVSWIAPSATDDVDGTVDVMCVPESGSTFGVGRTIVTCSAADAAGNTASGSFTVTVTPPLADPFGALDELLRGFNLPSGLAGSLGAKIRNAQAAVAHGDVTAACGQLGAFVQQARAQSGKGLTPEQSAALQEAATRIRLTLGC